MKKFIVPILSTIVLSAVLIALFLNYDLTPILASREGAGIDTLLQALFIVASVVFSLVMSFVVYSVVAFRRRPDDMEDAEPVHGHLGLEIAWTVIPLIAVVVLAIWGTVVLLDITGQPGQEELLIEVIGVQWAWSFDYPEYGFTSTDLVLPIDRQALLHIRSVDVIHSFWVPEFRVKIDAIPGVVNEVRITPSEMGEYVAYCSELCGTAHAYMTAPVHVLQQAEFEEWVAEQQALAAEQPEGTASGAQYAQEQGCLGCHSTDGSMLVGPTFQGLYGSWRMFEDGTAAVADDEYLIQSIIDPGAQIVQGYSNVMRQDYADLLGEDELQALVEFIRELGE
jgi:cytochrome c oxidase subunit 2